MNRSASETGPARRRARSSFPRSLEGLEDRTLLASGPTLEQLGQARPFAGGTAVGTIAPGAPLLFQIDPGSPALLVAEVHAPSVTARLSLLDATGRLIVQSDGQSTGNGDPLIDEHVVKATLYLEVQSLAGTGDATLSARETPASDPLSSLPGSAGKSTPIAAGYFDGGTTLDYATPNGVYLGRGDGTFDAPIDVANLDAAGSKISAIVAANFDGHVDLVVADAATNTVSILPGNGHGSFGAPITILGDGNEPVALLAGQFGPDGPMDLAVVEEDDQGNGDVAIVRGNGHGSFAVTATVPVGNSPLSIASGNFGGGGTDLAVVELDPSGEGGEVSILMSDGLGSFAPAPGSPIPVGSNPVSIVSGSFTDGGGMDLAVLDQGYSPGGGDVTILEGMGGGSFAARAPIALTGNDVPKAIVAGVFGDGGGTDLAVLGQNNDAASGDLTTLVRAGNGPYLVANTIPVGDTPDGLVAGDYNGDGRTDLAVANILDPDVSILLGIGQGEFVDTNAVDFSPIAVGDFNGDGLPDYAAPDGIHPGLADGTFQAATDIPELSAPGEMISAIVAGDFGGDGRADLAVANYLDDEVTIFMGDGRGGFRDAGSIAVGDHPTAIAVGDFNGDGRDDLAVANAFSDNVTILLSHGDGSFTDAGSVPVGGRPTSIVAGDFSGDGAVDLAVADGVSNDVTILRGDGRGSFRPEERIALTSVDYPSSIVKGDFVGDGRVDLAVAGMFSNDVAILARDGSGSFRQTATIALGGRSSPVALAAGDFTADGRTDLAVADQGSADVTILLSRAGGTFHVSAPIPFTQQEPSGNVVKSLIAGIAVGSFTRGGPEDLLIADENTADIVFLAGVGNGTFQGVAPDLVGATPQALAAGDFNGDGRTDLAVANYFSGNVSILLGNDDGTFKTMETIAVGIEPDAIVQGDFNGDGNLDLAVLDQGSASVPGDVKILLGNGAGDFTIAETIPVGLESIALVTGDFNADGHIDLAVLDGGTSTIPGDVTILLGDGRGNFTRQATFVGLQPSALAAGDFNGDGRTDLAVAGDNNDVQILMVVGGSLLPVARPIFVGANLNPVGIVAGDFNHDGRLDLAVASQNADGLGDGDVTILQGQGNGTFVLTSTISFPEVSYPLEIVAGDFNGNGNLDLAVTETGLGGVAVLLNHGDGGFQPSNTIAIAVSVGGILAADLNSDGKDDLTVTNQDSSLLVIEQSLGNGNFSPPPDAASTVRDTPLLADLGDGSQDLYSLNREGEILWRRAIPLDPGSFVPSVPINPGDPSRGITLIAGSHGSNPLIASIDALDNTVTLFAFRPLFATSLYTFAGGHFIQVGSLPTGSSPVQVLSGDLDGDGRADLVIRNAGDGTATVYLGDGRGGFTEGTGSSIPIGKDASDIVLADLDGSGRLDLVVSDESRGEVGVLVNLGGGTFGALSEYRAGVGTDGLASDMISTVSDAGTAGVAVGGFTTGGLPDIVAVDPGSDTFSVLDGLGGARFTNPTSTRASDPAGVVLVADLNGDGIPDLAMLGPDGVTVEFGNGRGGFVDPTSYPTGPDATGLSIATIGGQPALLVGDSFGDVRVFQELSPGVFGLSHKMDLPNLVVADGRFFQSNLSPNQVATQLNAAGSSAPAFGSSNGLEPGIAARADLAGDGIPDLIVPVPQANEILIYPGFGGGHFGLPQIVYVGADPVAVTAADFTGDGIPDLVVTNQGSNDLSVIVGQVVAGAWSPRFQLRLKTGYGPTGTVVLDVNGDGIPDIVVSDGGSADVREIPGLGGGYFDDQHPKVIPTGNDPGAPIVGDITGNPGEIDLVTLDAGSDSLTLVRDINRGGLVAQEISAGGSVPISATILSNDETGGVSLLVADYGDGFLALFDGVPSGLELVQIFQDPRLPHPFDLGLDVAGQLFADSEGVPSAIQVDLAQLGAIFVVGIGFPGSIDVPQIPEETVEPPPAASLESILVQTLVSTRIGPDAEPEEFGSSVTVEEVAISQEIAGLPNQSPAPVGCLIGPTDRDEPMEGGFPAQGENLPPSVVDILAGLDRALDEVRANARRGSLFGGNPGVPTSMRVLDAIDAVIARWSPVVGMAAGRSIAPAVGMARIGPIAARAVDAVLRSLDVRAGRAEAAPLPPSSGASDHLGVVTIGLAGFARSMDLVGKSSRPLHVPSNSSDGTAFGSRRRRNQ